MKTENTFRKGLESRHVQTAALLLGVLALSLLMVSATSAAPVLLKNGNSSVLVDPTSQAGVYQWLVDGRNFLAKQWFWGRVGNTPEVSVDMLDPTPFVFTSDGDGDLLNDRVVMRYDSPDGALTASVDLMLTGGAQGSGMSDMAEVIRVHNNSPISLDMHLFQYADFDLWPTAGDTVEFPFANTVRQKNGNAVMTETVVTPRPAHHEANIVPNTLNSLNDALPTTLNDNNGPLTGNVNWAFQWDFVLPAGGTFIISKDKQLTIVPEPGSVVLMGLGFVALVGCVWRRRAR
jgi:hypothetical protein